MTLNPTSSKGSGGGGSGTVTSVSSANTAISVASPTTAVVLTLATLDVIAADGPPAADWSNNSKKITSLANGSGAQDAAAFGQIPTALPPNGSASGDLGSTYPAPTVIAIHETSGPTKLTIGTITDGQFLKRVGTTLVSAAGGTGTVTSVASGDTSIVVTNPTTTPSLQIATLDVLATNRPPAADWSNNSHKITNLATGTSATDAANVGQLPLSATVSGSDVATSNTTATDITGLSLPLAANSVYTFSCWIKAVTSADANGIKYAVQFSAAGAAVVCVLLGAVTATTASGGSSLNTLNSLSATAYLGSSSQAGSVFITGHLTTGANPGNLTIQQAKVTSGTATAKIGSLLQAVKVA